MFSHTTARKIAEKHDGDYVLVDLKLDSRLKPLPVPEFERTVPKPLPPKRLADKLVPGDETYAIGSAAEQTKDQLIYYPGDLGLFGCVFEAWKNHWILRTSPADWWFPVACRIAKVVNEVAKQGGSTSRNVREFFVSHEEKQNIAVEVPVDSIYDANYDHLFSSFSSEIEERINIPEYAQVMQNDFETSGQAQKIASQLNLMASLQEFFTYEMRCAGCGLRGLEMSGSVEDWDSLPEKLQRVREILHPIRSEIGGIFGLTEEWWDHVLLVFRNLAKTRKDPNNKEVAKFWLSILMDTTGKKWIGGGGSIPRRKPVMVEAYDGWLVRFLTDKEKILAEDLKNGGLDKLSGWNQVPMKVTLTWCEPPIEDTSTLVAGIVGYVLHEGDNDEGDNRHSHREITRFFGSVFYPANQSETNKGLYELVPSIEPYHMWAMLLPPTSPLRR